MYSQGKILQKRRNNPICSNIRTNTFITINFEELQ